MTEQSAEIDAPAPAPYHADEQCHECGEPYWICRTGTCPGDFVDDQGECAHSWLDRPESDTHECLICGYEGSGPVPVMPSGSTEVVDRG